MAVGRWETHPGTRILTRTFGLVGARFRDPSWSNRTWTVVHVFAPLVIRKDRGMRCRVLDDKGVASFIEAADLELVLGNAKPGELCPWTGEGYPAIGDESAGWVGLGMDEHDVNDDLHIRELELRQEMGWESLPSLQITRYLHMSEYRDVEQLDLLISDVDPNTGAPDYGVDTITRRWRRVQSEGVSWTKL